MSTALQTSEPVHTPWALKVIAAGAVLIPIAMMVTNTDFKIKGLEAANQKASTQLIENEVTIVSLRELIVAGEQERGQLEVKITGLETREAQLEEIAILLKEEIIIAEQEAKMLAMNYSRSSAQLASLADESEEAAYILARENEILKTRTRDKDNHVLNLLTEVSTLNTELAFVKDERDELNGEILRINAQVRSMEVKETVMQAQNGGSNSTVAIP
jgi:chromosome segregation ATPase